MTDVKGGKGPEQKGHHVQSSISKPGHTKQKSSIHMVEQMQKHEVAKTEADRKQLDVMSPEERARRLHIRVTDTDTAPWVKSQIKAFTGWANNFLPARRLEEATFPQQMADGTIAIELLTVLDGKVFKKYHKKPLNKYHSIENWELVLKSLKEGGLYVGAQDPYVLSDPKRNVKMLLGLVWQTILKFGLRPKKTGIADKLKKRGDDSRDAAVFGSTDDGVEVSSSSGHSNNMFNELKSWCNDKLKLSEGRDPSIAVSDFTKSFENGLVFCHLLNAMKPGVINVKNLNKDQAQQNLNTAFSLAYKHLGIPELLTADPAFMDAHSVMTYVSLWRLKDLAPDEIKTMSAESPRADTSEIHVPVIMSQVDQTPRKWQTCKENGQRCACSEIAHPDVGPMTLDLRHEPSGALLLCNCGMSSTFPNCDKKTCNDMNATTGTSWVGFLAERSQLGDAVVFCACGHSKTRNIGIPICDGSCRHLVDMESGLTGTLHARKDSHGTLDLTHPLVSKLMAGQHFLSFNATDPHQEDTFAWFNPRDGSCGTLHWSRGTVAAHDEAPFRSIPVDQITDVLLGKQTQILQQYATKYSEKECFSIVGMETTMDLKADNEAALLGWLDGFEHILRHYGKMIEDDAEANNAMLLGASPINGGGDVQGHNLTFTAKDLISATGSTVSPNAMVSVYCKNPETARYEWVGETEVVANSRNPEYAAKVFVPNKYQDQWVKVAVNHVDQSSLVTPAGQSGTGNLGETTVRMSDLIDNAGRPQTLDLASENASTSQQLKENSSTLSITARPTNAGFTSLDDSRSPLNKRASMEKQGSGYGAIMGFDGDLGDRPDSKRVAVNAGNLRMGQEENGSTPSIENMPAAQKLYKGTNFILYQFQGDQAVKRPVFVFFSSTGGPLGSVYWCKPGVRIESPNARIGLHTITDVYLGKNSKHSPIWKNAIASGASDKRCFTIAGKFDTLNLEGDNRKDITDWIQGISHIVTTAGKKKAKHKLLGRNREVDDFDAEKTAVYQATCYNSLEALEAVLEAGDNLKGAVDHSLFRAAFDHDAQKTACLLSFRANPRVTDNGETPLHRALMWSELSSPKLLEPIIRLLISAGAMADARDSEGVEPIEYLTQQQQEALRDAFTESRPLADVARSYGYEKPQQEEWL